MVLLLFILFVSDVCTGTSLPILIEPSLLLAINSDGLDNILTSPSDARAFKEAAKFPDVPLTIKPKGLLSTASDALPKLFCNTDLPSLNCQSNPKL